MLPSFSSGKRFRKYLKVFSIAICSCSCLQFCVHTRNDSRGGGVSKCCFNIEIVILPAVGPVIKRFYTQLLLRPPSRSLTNHITAKSSSERPLKEMKGKGLVSLFCTFCAELFVCVCIRSIVDYRLFNPASRWPLASFFSFPIPPFRSGEWVPLALGCTLSPPPSPRRRPL